MWTNEKSEKWNAQRKIQISVQMLWTQLYLDKNGYPEEVKREAIRYYLEEIGFRRIERMLHVSHVSVINRVKKSSNEIRKNKKIVSTKTDVLELDEICTNF